MQVIHDPLSGNNAGANAGGGRDVAPKVVWVISGKELYGERRAVLSLMQGVSAAGWQVEAIALTAGECVDAMKAAGLKVSLLYGYDLPGMHKAPGKVARTWELAKLAGRQVGLSRRIFEELRARRADCVHVLSVTMMPAVAWAARRLRIPCFWEMTAIIGSGYPLGLNRRVYQRIIRMLDIHTLANSRFTAQTLGSFGRAVEVMHLGVDPVRFDSARSFGVGRERLGIPADAKVFVIAARLDASKGQAVFLEAMLSTGDSSLHLVIIGGDPNAPQAQQIKAMAAAANAADRVHLIPFTPEPEAYVALADVAVNSRLDAEPFGLSVVEAMMLGKPLLVHALGGPAETVMDGETGWHVKAATVEGFRAGIERALNDKACWKAMGSAARRRALKHFSIAVQARQYQQIVAGVLAARGLRR